MPFLDGTGPLGIGGCGVPYGRLYGLRGGFGYGRGLGFGFGRNGGYGWRYYYRPYYAPIGVAPYPPVTGNVTTAPTITAIDPFTPENRIKALEAYKQNLEETIKSVEKEIETLKKQAHNA